MGNLSLVSLTLVAGLMGSSQHSSALTDRVDLVEVNHFCDCLLYTSPSPRD